MKYLGLLSILISSVYIGLYLRTSLKSRLTALEQTERMIELIETEVNYMNSDIISLLELLSVQKGFNQLVFINDCLSFMKNGEDFDAAWQKAINGFNSALNSADKEILLTFGYQLGKSDLQGQLNNCRLHREKIKSNLSDAENRLVKYGNLSLRLPLLFGIMLIIILY